MLSVAVASCTSYTKPHIRTTQHIEPTANTSNARHDIRGDAGNKGIFPPCRSLWRVKSRDDTQLGGSVWLPEVCYISNDSQVVARSPLFPIWTSSDSPFHCQMKLQTDGSIPPQVEAGCFAELLVRNVKCVKHQLIFERLAKVAEGLTNGSKVNPKMAKSLLIAIPSRTCGINKTGALIEHRLHVKPSIAQLTD
jgi:hypothetical protein